MPQEATKWEARRILGDNAVEELEVEVSSNLISTKSSSITVEAEAQEEDNGNQGMRT